MKNKVEYYQVPKLELGNCKGIKTGSTEIGNLSNSFGIRLSTTNDIANKDDNTFCLRTGEVKIYLYQIH